MLDNLRHHSFQMQLATTNVKAVGPGSIMPHLAGGRISTTRTSMMLLKACFHKHSSWNVMKPVWMVLEGHILQHFGRWFWILLYMCDPLTPSFVKVSTFGWSIHSLCRIGFSVFWWSKKIVHWNWNCSSISHNNKNTSWMFGWPWSLKHPSIQIIYSPQPVNRWLMLVVAVAGWFEKYLLILSYFHNRLGEMIQF